MKLHALHFSSWIGTPISIAGGAGTAQVDLSMLDFDNTAATNDIAVSHATVRIVEATYDVATGVSSGTGATVTSWP